MGAEIMNEGCRMAYKDLLVWLTIVPAHEARLGEDHGAGALALPLAHAAGCGLPEFSPQGPGLGIGLLNLLGNGARSKFHRGSGMARPP